MAPLSREACQGQTYAFGREAYRLQLLELLARSDPDRTYEALKRLLRNDNLPRDALPEVEDPVYHQREARLLDRLRADRLIV